MSTIGDHSRVAQTLLVAVEATEGTIGSTFRTLPSLQVDIDMDANINTYRPSGNKYPTIAIEGKEWTMGKLSGPITYDEIVYLLSSIVNYIAPAGPTNTTVYTWTHTPSSTAQDTSKAYSIEWGDGASGSQYRTLGNFVNELSLKFTREAVELDGAVLGRRLSAGVTPSSSASTIDNSPVSPAAVDLFYDTSAASNLSAESNPLTRAFEATFSIKKRFNPFWPLQSSQTSFAGRVEDAPDVTLSLKVGSDTSGTDFVAPFTLSALRNGTTIYLRIKCSNGVIPGSGPSTNYKLLLDGAYKVTKAVKFEDIDGTLLGLGWEFTAFHDSTWGKAYQFVVTNHTSAL